MASRFSPNPSQDMQYNEIQFVTYTQEEMPTTSSPWGTVKGYRTISIIAISMFLFALFLKVTVSEEIFEVVLFLEGAILIIMTGCMGPYRYQPERQIRIVRPKPEAVVCGKVAITGFVSQEAIGNEVKLMIDGKIIAKLIPDKEVFLYVINTTKKWPSKFVTLTSKVTVKGKEYSSELSFYIDNTEDAVLSSHEKEVVIERERVFPPRTFQYGYLIYLIVLGFLLMSVSAII